MSNSAACMPAWSRSNWGVVVIVAWPISSTSDPHTVARGRQQLLAQDVEVDRARKAGGGRKPVEKKHPK